VPALAARMHGREPIEWQDRAWRLLGNQGQVSTDEWGSIGAVGGAVAGWRVAAAGGGGRGRWKEVLGGVGVGFLAGAAGSLVYRKVVRGEEKS